MSSLLLLKSSCLNLNVANFCCRWMEENKEKKKGINWEYAAEKTSDHGRCCCEDHVCVCACFYVVVAEGKAKKNVAVKMENFSTFRFFQIISKYRQKLHLSLKKRRCNRIEKNVKRRKSILRSFILLVHTTLWEKWKGIDFCYVGWWW